MNEVPESMTLSRQTMLELYMSGFASGAASAVKSVLPQAGDEGADIISDRMIDGIEGDPAVMDVVWQQIAEILSEVDSGPTNITSHAT